MKPEAQRIAIAEACGWNLETRKGHLSKKQTSGWRPPNPTPSGFHEKGIYNTSSLPDYLNDLNAMHEAENLLLRDMNKLWYPYCKRLHETTNGIGEGATAAQRAEAFLRTLGLWKNDACPQDKISTTANP